jgi:hypothetical protein
VSAGDEVLVELVRGGVGDARREGGDLVAERPPEQRARIAYSVVCASLRRSRSQPPRPEDRFGTDENAKIIAAQATTGIHAEVRRETGTFG